MRDLPALPASMRLFERDWLSSNNLMLFDGDRATLVDTGYDSHKQTTLALVVHALAERPGCRLERILNTHLHSDHCGGNALLAARLGARISVPAATFDAVRAWDASSLTYAALAQTCERFPVDDRLAPGDRFVAGATEWHALAAPGHDPTSLIFFAPEHGLLLSADALWANGFGLLFPEFEGESGIAEQRATLALIETLDARVVVPGHGPMFADVTEAIARARRRLDAIEADIDSHLRHAMRALIMFRMLAQRHERIESLIDAYRDAHLMHAMAARLGMDTATALRSAIDSLVTGGQLEQDGACVRCH